MTFSRSRSLQSQMYKAPRAMPYRSIGEWELRSEHAYENPFASVTVDATFTSPSGKNFTVPGFHDGENTWRVRFNPGEVGTWSYLISSYPSDRNLVQEGSFEVTSSEHPGFLQATPGHAWGFHYESGEPVFLLGDTVYNLFGMAHCGANVVPFLERRARQGFNVLRVRLPVSPFHPPDGYNTWQTCRTWPWGGSEQAPRFDHFNLDYFHTVDTVLHQVERLGIGLEMIMEAWGFEFPFNSRNIFVPEWEELWMRYLIARYDAFSSVYFWTPLNEYEYYPNGDWHYKPVADRWAMRVSRWIKSVAQHGHVVAAHNGPVEPPFAKRFAADPEAVDTIMFQEWGTSNEKDGWLASGIDDQVSRSLRGWRGSAVLAEYGYERNPDFELLVPGHAYCDPEHTRRGAWRGAFCSLGVIHGFENSWGPWQALDKDQDGLAYLIQMRRFFTEVVPFHKLQPAPELIASNDDSPGRRPLALTTANCDTVAVYLPVGGTIHLSLPVGNSYSARWFDPRTGELHTTNTSIESMEAIFEMPVDERERPQDWILLLSTNCENGGD